MKRISINFLVINIVLATSLFLSVPASATTPKPRSYCRDALEVCIGYGDYNCCKGLSCLGWKPNLPLGFGVCTPPGQEPQPPTKCPTRLQVCVPYGQYQCCDGLHCANPRDPPSFRGVQPPALDIPPGVGICI